MVEAKNIMHVGNVVLTEECLGMLEIFQSCKNEMINDTVKVMLNAIMLLSLPITDISDRIKEKRINTISDLSLIIDNLEELGTP